MKLFLIAVLAAVALISCNKEPEQAAPPVSTEKNVFEELREKTSKNPQDAESWYHLADLYEQSEMYREELDALQKVLAIDPGKGYAYIKMGNANNRLGQYQDAIKYFKKALKYFPQNPVLYNNLAVSFGKVGNLQEEIAALEKAISLRPRYATARYNLGMAMLSKGMRAEALQQYAEINKFDSGVAVALKKEIDRKEK
jgi:tetratricopeptide (TPR) repeat protein